MGSDDNSRLPRARGKTSRRKLTVNRSNIARRRAAALAAAFVLSCPAVRAVGAEVTAAPAYALTGRIGLGPGAHWDYAFVDTPARRLYVAHADRIDVVDLERRARIGTIGSLQGAHGVAVAGRFGRGYISDGKADAVVIFDLATLARAGTVAVGHNPDAIVLDPSSQRIVVFNGRSHDASILDAASGAVLAPSIPLGGKPEFARADGAGAVYVNIEDTAEIVVLDARRARVARRYPIAACEEPTGLAIDPARRLYSVCANRRMIVSDPATGTVLGQAAIGPHPDGVVFDDGMAFSANGGDGTITVVGNDGAGAPGVAATIGSQAGARTIDVDPRTHALYLPAPAADGVDVLVFERHR
jgi:DNA-binding beta-propeller fold protein YncE